MNQYLKQIKEGMVNQNPIFMQFLGMCPTLATTTSVSNAVGMGLAATAVLICSNVIISLLRKFIPKEIRIASYIVIISGFVTAVELLMKAYLQSLYNSLGLYIPLIVVNCIILARAEAFASKNPVLPSAIDGLSMGLGFTVSLILISSVREILGAGTWLGLPIMGSWYTPATIFILPAGAFLTLGILAALVNAIKTYIAAHPRSLKMITADTAETVAVIPDEAIVGGKETVTETSTPASSDTEKAETKEENSEKTEAADTQDAVLQEKPQKAEEQTTSVSKSTEDTEASIPPAQSDATADGANTDAADTAIPESDIDTPESAAMESVTEPVEETEPQASDNTYSETPKQNNSVIADSETVESEEKNLGTTD